MLRGLEEFARRALFTALIQRSARRRVVQPYELASRGLRILFIAEDAIGDTILSMPTIRAIAGAHAENQVDVVTWPHAARLFDNVPFVRRVIEMPRYDGRRRHAFHAIRASGPYDAVVDGMVLRRQVRSRSLAMMLGAQAEYWIGEAGRVNEHLLNVAVPRASLSSLHLDRVLALAEPFGVHAPERRPLLVVSADERDMAGRTWDVDSSQLRILINISAHGADRRWDPVHYTAVAAHLRRHHCDASIVLVSMMSDRQTAEDIASAADVRCVVPSVRELIALVEGASLVVSPDTSVCHIASVFSRPLVSLYNTGKEEWYPFDTPGVRMVATTKENFVGLTDLNMIPAVDRALDDLLLAAASPSLGMRQVPEHAVS